MPIDFDDLDAVDLPDVEPDGGADAEADLEAEAQADAAENSRESAPPQGRDKRRGRDEDAVRAEPARQEPGRGPDRRKTVIDRRSGLERRQLTAEQSGFNGPERRKGERRGTGLERRRGPGRRRADDRRCAEEGEMTTEQFEFVMAIETYKKVNKRIYPTWTEVLEVISQLGYRKVYARDITLENVPEPALTKVDADAA
jgi:hypothetical protein